MSKWAQSSWGALREAPGRLRVEHLATGALPALIFGLSLTLVQVSQMQAVHATQTQIVAMVSASWFFGGLMGIVLTLKSRTPICGGWSVPAFILLFSTMQNAGLSLGAALGGAFMASVLLAAVAASGLQTRLVKWVPLPILLGMVAGVLFRFPLLAVSSLGHAPIVAVVSLLGYALFELRLRPGTGVLGALLCGVGAALFLGQMGGLPARVALGQLALPPLSFSASGFFSIALPLLLVVVSANTMQAAGALMGAGFRAPAMEISLGSGLFGMLAVLAGGFGTSIGAPSTALSAGEDAGPFEGRYVSGLLSSLTYLLFGIFGGTAVLVAGAIPQPLSSLLIGLVLFKVVMDALKKALLAGTCTKGAMVSFVISMSGQSLFHIGAPFWALVGGVLWSLILERKEYFHHVEAPEAAGALPAS